MSAEPPTSALTLRQLLLVSRPALWINTLGVAVTGLWLSGQLWSHAPVWYALLAYLSLPFNLLIYGVNDLYDQAEDAGNARKGGWQGARLNEAQRGPLLLAIAALNVPFALGFAFMLPWPALSVLALSVLLFVGYSVPPVRFKARPFLDGLSNVAYALPVLLPVLALGGPNADYDAPWRVCGVLALYSVGKHAFDAAQDITPDLEAGTATVATTLGLRGAAGYALACFALAGLSLWPLSRLAACALWLVCGGMALGLLLRPTQVQAARLYPLSVLSPWLVGSVGGVQLVYLLVRGGW